MALIVRVSGTTSKTRRLDWSLVDHADLALARQLEQEPAWARVLCDGFVKIIRGHWNREYVALITDRWGGGLTFGDVFCFLQVHGLLASGGALLTRIDVGAPPLGDRQVEENNKILDALPSTFAGRFWGGRMDDDGYIEWTEPIQANVILNDGAEKGQTIPPGRAPLEVGHTNGFITLRHLKSSGHLARWPYQSNSITVIHFLPSALADS